MDKLKGFAEKAMHSAADKSSSTTGDTATGAQGSSGQEDYGDKGIDAIEKKFGINVSREQNEKYSDMAREEYEKKTGHQVNSKFSN